MHTGNVKVIFFFTENRSQVIAFLRVLIMKLIDILNHGTFSVKQ